MFNAQFSLFALLMEKLIKLSFFLLQVMMFCYIKTKIIVTKDKKIEVVGEMSMMNLNKGIPMTCMYRREILEQIKPMIAPMIVSPNQWQ